jgi:hypothetical protein
VGAQTGRTRFSRLYRARSGAAFDARDRGLEERGRYEPGADDITDRRDAGEW